MKLGSIVIRRGEVEDAAQCAAISYEAFKTNAERHNFPLEVTPPDTGKVSRWRERISNPTYYVVVVELDGRIVGSNVLDGRDSIAGVGPLTVDPSIQDNRVGRRLMEAVLIRSVEKQHPGVRLVQTAYNRRSLALYAKLGFEVREMLASMQGPALQSQIPGHEVRPATKTDLDFCNQLCRRVHGHERGVVLLDAIEQGTATVVEREDRITGYATVIGFTEYAIGESNSDLKALIGAAPEFEGIAGFLLPTRNGELFRWCLQNGLRIVLPMTLMSLGLYNEPRDRSCHRSTTKVLSLGCQLWNSDSGLPFRVGSCSGYGPERSSGLASGIAPRRPREVYRAGAASKCGLTTRQTVRKVPEEPGIFVVGGVFGGL